MTDDQIHDEIRRSTDSAIQALTNLVQSVIVDNRNHRQEEATAREEHRERMVVEVKETMDQQFNGKVKNILSLMNEMTQSQKEQTVKIDTIVRRTNPLVEQYEERVGFTKTVKKYGVNMGLIATAIGVTVIVFEYVNKLAK
jgi:hypothetical protein